MRQEFEGNSFIEAGTSITIGKNFRIGKNVQIKVRGSFTVGDYSRFGDDVDIETGEAWIGNNFFHHTPGLRIGGGGTQHQDSSIHIGHNCVVHNNYINTARRVWLGSNVGLSPNVDIITHGFWNSPLEGFPVEYGPVTIYAGTIVGQRSLILPGVRIVEDVVIGANSTVTRDITVRKSVWAGNPARFIRQLDSLVAYDQAKIAQNIVGQFPGAAMLNFPVATVSNVRIDLVNRTLVGIEDEVSDNFRDHLRRNGIKVHTTRPFGTWVA